MTGLKSPEKMSSDKVSGAEEDQPTTGKRKRSVLIGVIASLSTVLVLGVVLFGVVFYYQEKINDEKQEWIFWSRRAGNTVLQEAILIDSNEQNILILSAASYRLHEDNSMALYDFKQGYVAIRDFKENLCFVSDVPNRNFRSMKATLEARRGRQLDLPRQEAMLRPGNMTSSELGPKLSNFCHEVPAFWFDVISKSGIEKRRTTKRCKEKWINIDIRIRIRIRIFRRCKTTETTSHPTIPKSNPTNTITTAAKTTATILNH